MVIYDLLYQISCMQLKLSSIQMFSCIIKLMDVFIIYLINTFVHSVVFKACTPLSTIQLKSIDTCTNMAHFQMYHDIQV